MNQSCLELNHVSGIDEKEIPLEDVSLQAMQGEMHVILGMDYQELGCMLRLLSGRFRMAKGQVLASQKAISLSALSRRFQYIMSDSVLVDQFSVFDNIYLMKSQLDTAVRRKELWQRAETLMEHVGVTLELEKK